MQHRAIPSGFNWVLPVDPFVRVGNRDRDDPSSTSTKLEIATVCAKLAAKRCFAGGVVAVAHQLAALGRHVVAGVGYLCWLQVADLAAHNAPKAPWWKHAGYLVAWPGMDAEAFLNGQSHTPVLWSEWLFAGGKLTLGLLWLFVVIRWIPAEQAYAAGWAGMLGIVLVLHFGLFHLLSCFWRSCGVDARPLMHWPLASDERERVLGPAVEHGVSRFDALDSCFAHSRQSSAREERSSPASSAAA